MVAGVIYDPMRRELFVATKGGGATLNGRRIRVSRTRRLSLSLLSTGFSSNFLTQPQPYLKWFEEFQHRSHGVRRIGSTVYCLSAIAAGRLDGFYEQDLWPWDIAAGILLVEEAGGRVSNFAGTAPQLTGGRLVASNGRIHADMLSVLQTRSSRTKISV
jgi:myo-inositol-1(or 4)-monophosphatase